jgi:hypothetical protein
MFKILSAYICLVGSGKPVLYIGRTVLKVYSGNCRAKREAIQINHQLDATISPVYYLDFYLQLNMFRASSRPLSGAQQMQ